MTVAAATAQTPRIRQSARRLLPWLILFLIAAGLVGLTLLQTGVVSSSGPALGASNPAPDGAKAVVSVLSAHGVHVAEASTLAGATRQGGPDAAVIVYDPQGILDSAQFESLRTAFGSIVLVQPDAVALSRLMPGVRVTGTLGHTTTRRAGCTDPAAMRAGTIATSGAEFRVGGDAIGCFPQTGGDVTFASLTGQGRPAITALGSPQVFENQHIADAGNAALALNVLGTQPHLVWYLPSLADLGAGAPVSLAALTPGWVTPIVILCALVFLAAALWRGRRFGPLVFERMPVVVRANETADGRALLYERSSARLRAIDAIRMGTLDRLASALALPRSADIDEVAYAAAVTLGASLPEILGLLRDDPVDTDARLMAVSDGLRELERRIVRAIRERGGGAPHPGPGRMEA